MSEALDRRTCPDTGALIFRTPAQVRRQQELNEKLSQENSQLKVLLAALVAAQPAEVRAALPTGLLELSQNPPGPAS